MADYTLLDDGKSSGLLSDPRCLDVVDIDAVRDFEFLFAQDIPDLRPVLKRGFVPDLANKRPGRIKNPDRALRR